MGILCLHFASAVLGADRVRIVAAGTESSTNAQIVSDIAKHIGQAANIKLDLQNATGSPDALMKLRDGRGLQFGIVQSDSAEAYLGAAARGNIEADQLFAPVRVIAPLHHENLYFIVRKGSPLNFIHEIENARINLGTRRSGTALTTATLYRLMYGKSIPDQLVSFFTHRDALIKLTEQAIDVVVLVAPQPARVLAEMKPEAREFVKFLKFDPGNPVAALATKIYTPATISQASYPNLLTEDLPALAVRMYLISYGGNDTLQARFARAWCQNLSELRSDGHPALRELEPSPPPLVPRWQYSIPFERALLACREGKEAPLESCSTEERALGLCG